MSVSLTNEETYEDEWNECSFDFRFILLAVVSTFVFLIICVLGLILNLFVLVVFCFHKKACTVPEIYLSNLAAADFLLMCSLPIGVLGSINKYISDATCKLKTAAVSMSCSCSSGFLVLVSIDRYLALVHPLSHERLRRPIYAKLGCVLVWSLGFLLNIHHLIYLEAVQDPWDNVTRCNSDYQSMTSSMLLNVMFSIFTFFIPLCIMCFCTVKILKVLRNRIPESSNTQKTERKATTLVLVVLLMFLICWLPFHGMHLLFLFSSYFSNDECYVELVMQFIVYFSFILGYFNSFLNPILYIIVGKTFRTKVKEFFQQCRGVSIRR